MPHFRDGLRTRRDILADGLTASDFEVYRPQGTSFITTGITPFGDQDALPFRRALPENRLGGVLAACPATSALDIRDMHHSWYMDYGWYMSMKRTNVYADPEDLAIIKEAAARRGISEAEIIRQGIHLAAMASRVWDEPLFSRTFEGPGRTPAKEDVRNAVADSVRRESGPGTAA